MTDIAKRLKAATGPDRELDLAIHLHLFPDGDIAKIVKHPRGFGIEGYSWDFYGKSICFEKRMPDGTCPFNGGYPLPEYTGSIDAATTLVPSGKQWLAGVGRVSPDEPLYGATIYEAEISGIEIGQGETNVNLPIAICMAAFSANKG